MYSCVYFLFLFPLCSGLVYQKYTNTSVGSWGVGVQLNIFLTSEYSCNVFLLVVWPLAIRGAWTLTFQQYLLTYKSS